MKRRQKGITLILFGILLLLAHMDLNKLLWSFGIGLTIPFSLCGVIFGVAGLILAFWPGKNKS